MSTSPELTMDPFLALFAGDPTTNATTTTTTIADLTPSNASNSPPEPGGQRSRSGCFTCRRRKVKCDESRPICEKCQIGQREVCGCPLAS
jgi:hypothetical protein